MNYRKKLRVLIMISVLFCFTGTLWNVVDVSATATTPVYRVYNPNTGEHLHTMNAGERDHLSSIGWRYEGVSMYMPTTGTPLYRLYNKNTGEHFYTLNRDEQNFLVKNGWKPEGVAWNTPKTGTPLYRLYNPNEQKAGAHHYTTLVAEKDMLIKAGWKYEGVAWYSLSNGSPVSTPVTTKTSDTIVEIANKQKGVRYLWGGTTPAGFDCSGLTQYVYKQAKGINIGRVTTEQEKAGTIISLNQAKPGDLLFWGRKGSTYHVAIYVGNGNYIHAPQPGQNVKVQNMRWYMPSFALRVN